MIAKIKKSKNIFISAISKYNPDIILINDIDTYFLSAQIEYGIPSILIFHEPLTRDIRYLTTFDELHKFIACGGNIYFVSENQFNFFQQNIERITGNKLKYINGYCTPTFASENMCHSTDRIYDAVTLGRTDVLKNPFLLHKKIQYSDLKSVVLTDGNNTQQKPAQIDYYTKNLHWKDNQKTFRGLTHSQNMSVLNQSKCYVSTMPEESFGITVVEALCYGLPVILFVNKNNNHSSESIFSNSEFYVKINRNINSVEFINIVKNVSNISQSKRIEIAESVFKTHSKEIFKQKFEEIFNLRMEKTQKRFQLYVN